MDSEYKKEIAFRMLARASAGLYFLEDFLYRHSAKDGAYFRSLCVLLSYSFELLLKAQFVLVNEFETKKQLEDELKNLNHNLFKIAEGLGIQNLNAVGIKSVGNREETDFIGYVIETLEGKQVIVEDFINIRYDFTNDALRDLPENEVFKEWVNTGLEVYSRLKKLYLEDMKIKTEKD